ncbi:hypothetical protein [Fowlpox virus]|uniref:Uncharacterized protein n=1 Tax=Fowlpox virus TaxID=10261 RepID=A0A891LXV5_FOWPV|nr:hypothetical protein [Fowlpox virus]UNS14386.1 ALPV-222 [Albatrosspox virus]UQT20461.1 hypothetical protein [Fowlpox virus]UQT20705.1 hypothetical protein [Fowlpox virus]WPD90873.1 hypothetical protein PPV_Vac110-(162-163)n1 [Avipoxvirus sp.]
MIVIVFTRNYEIIFNFLTEFIYMMYVFKIITINKPLKYYNISFQHNEKNLHLRNLI